MASLTHAPNAMPAPVVAWRLRCSTRHHGGGSRSPAWQTSGHLHHHEMRPERMYRQHQFLISSVPGGVGVGVGVVVGGGGGLVAVIVVQPKCYRPQLDSKNTKDNRKMK